jgi:SAM-dependent methyltransferase
MTSIYDDAFYTRQREGSKRSARIILPIIFDLIKPQSIVDIGCGVGTWLSVASELGVGNLVGFEGNWVKDVRKEEGNFSVNFSDLERKIATADRFDLAICLEVAEHLSEARADSLVADLCSLSDVVLFGAAVPGQGGTGHVNEQWQSYWANNFQKNGLLAYDVIRPEVWTNDQVRPWYRQNILLYSRKPLPGYQAARMVDVIHPVVYKWKNPPTFRYLVGELPGAFKRAVARRL